MPFVVKWEAEIQRKLISDPINNRAHFQVKALLRGDSKSRAEYYAHMVSNGMMSRDEVRVSEDMNPRGGAADGLYLQSNMAPIEIIAKGDHLKKDTPAAEESQDQTENIDQEDTEEPEAKYKNMPIARKIAEKIDAREVKAVERIISKGADAKALDEFYQTQINFAVDFVNPLLESGEASAEFTQLVADDVKKYYLNRAEDAKKGILDEDSILAIITQRF